MHIAIQILCLPPNPRFNQTPNTFGWHVRSFVVDVVDGSAA